MRCLPAQVDRIVSFLNLALTPAKRAALLQAVTFDTMKSGGGFAGMLLRKGGASATGITHNPDPRPHADPNPNPDPDPDLDPKPGPNPKPNLNPVALTPSLTLTLTLTLTPTPTPTLTLPSASPSR